MRLLLGEPGDWRLASDMGREFLGRAIPVRSHLWFCDCASGGDHSGLCLCLSEVHAVHVVLCIALVMCLSECRVVDVVPGVMQAMWTLRESLPEALLREGYAWLYDVSLPHHKFYESVEDMRQHLSGFSSDRVTRICGFGHLGKYTEPPGSYSPTELTRELRSRSGTYRMCAQIWPTRCKKTLSGWKSAAWSGLDLCGGLTSLVW